MGGTESSCEEGKGMTQVVGGGFKGSTKSSPAVCIDTRRAYIYCARAITVLEIF